MAKLVQVIKETIVTYKVDTAPGVVITDDQAIDIVKLRIEAGAPLDIINEEAKTMRFTVSDTDENGPST